MSEYNVIFDIVLYFSRKEIIKPIEPSFNNIREENPELIMDELLDMYSELRKKYKEDLIVYENTNSNEIVVDSTLFPEDETFEENVRKFEKNEFFIDWNEKTKLLINRIIEDIKS